VSSAETVRPTRERILDVAEELIAVHGMAGLVMKDVAAAVGVRPPSLFAHFGGREAIGDAVAQRVMVRIAEIFDRVLNDASGDPESLMREGVRAYAGHLYDHPADVRMILRDLARVRGGGGIDLSGPVIEELGVGIGALLARGVATGCFRPVDTGAFMSLVQGSVVGAIGWYGFGENGEALVPRSRAEIQDDAEALAFFYLRRGVDG
jgi:AcrR family transcriptional regulator